MTTTTILSPKSIQSSITASSQLLARISCSIAVGIMRLSESDFSSDGIVTSASSSVVLLNCLILKVSQMRKNHLDLDKKRKFVVSVNPARLLTCLGKSSIGIKPSFDGAQTSTSS
ncbi:hypothetical protein Ancab_037568 [Ancistrocladus abbreviatus]